MKPSAAMAFFLASCGQFLYDNKRQQKLSELLIRANDMRKADEERERGR